MNNLILPFNKLSSQDVNLAGGKGASLGEMTQAGIPVPPGFVVLADAFRAMVKANGIGEKIDGILGTVDVVKTETIDEASEKIRAMIKEAKTPKDVSNEITKAFEELDTEFVAVRSSATAEDSSSASWAGELETYLNTTKGNLLDTVKECWSSLFTPRAIFYRIEKNMVADEVAVAVVVQKMVQSEIAGIAFTVHPVTKNQNTMVIEAGWGLGEAIVGGLVIPDTYVIDKEKNTILEKYPSVQKIMIDRVGNETKEVPVPEEKKEKQKLTDQEILELAELCENIEKHYGNPQDIEWARENDKFYVVQSRPITTLDNVKPSPVNTSLIEEVNRDWSKASTRRMTYQKIRLYHDGLVRGFKDIFDYDQHFSLSRVIDGNVIFYTSSKETNGQSTYILKKFIDPEFINSTLRTLGKEISQSFHDYVIFAKSLPQDWSSFSNKDLIKNVNRFYEEDRKVELYYWILFNDIEKVFVSAIRQVMIEKAYDQNTIENLISLGSQPLLITPLDMERLFMLKVALCKVSQKEDSLKKHWQEFSFLPMYDIDYESYDLEYFKKELEHIEEKLTMSDIENEIDDITSKYKIRKNQYLNLVDSFGEDKTALTMLEFLSDYASQKDRKPYVRDQGSYYIRNLFIEISKRLGLSLEEVLFLTKLELESALKGDFDLSTLEIKDRIQNSAFLLKDDEVHIFTKPEELAIVDSFIEEKEEGLLELKGLAVSAGKAKGRVALVISNKDFTKFQPGQILVTSSTRPDFVPLMKKAAAVLTDEGGILSHAAIISRELGLPCVVGIKNATQVLKDGDMVEVDADNGIIVKK